jgi:threonine synthase
VPSKRTTRGIWRYRERYSPILPETASLSLGEGDTPAIEVPALAETLGLERLLLKREDLNPSGSHKDRGVAFQISALRHAQPHLRWITISSSGNAAISAAAYAGLAGLKVAAFVAPSTPVGKVTRLRRLGAEVLVSSRALSIAAELARKRGIPNLRPSTDPLAIEGFQSIGWELQDRIEAVDGIFSFVSSGTSFVGIGRAFGAKAPADLSWTTGLHAVQGSGASPIAGEYDPRDIVEPQSRLGALGARKTRRVGEAKRLINESGGRGWVMLDAEADQAQSLLLAHGIESSLEGAASLAAAGRAARETGLKSALVVLTGRRVAQAQDFEPVVDALDLKLIDSVKEAEARIEAASS